MVSLISDDDEEESVVALVQTKLLPSVPLDKGPKFTFLCTLLDNAIQKNYHDLTVLSELLQKKQDGDRKKSIVEFAYATRLLFIRLLAVVKWVKNAGKVDACTAIRYFLEQQGSFFVETADSMVFLARAELTEARLPAFQIPAAVDVLTLGSYPRLPVCLKSRFVPEDSISEREQAGCLQRLNQVIQYRLACGARFLPSRIKNILVRNGMVTLRVPGEFEASLTLLGQMLDTSWTLLNIKILVQDFEIGDGRELVHPMQLHYLHQIVQARLTSCDHPLTELYTIVHSFCQSLQLDLLYCQSTMLVANRLTNNFAVESYREGNHLTVAYWPSHLGPRVSQSRPSLQYRMTIEVDRDPHQQGLRVKHSPLDFDKGETLPSLDCDGGRLSMEHLLTGTALVRCRQKLRQLRTKLEKLTGAQCALTGSAVPSFTLPLIDPPDLDEHLNVAVNVFSGMIICRIPRLGTSQTLKDFERSVNGDRTIVCSAEDLIAKLRCELLAERCRSTISSLPVRIVDEPSVLAAISKIHITAENSFLMQFHRDDNCYLALSLDCQSCNNVQINYYLISTEPSKLAVLTPGQATGSGIISKLLEAIKLEPEQFYSRRNPTAKLSSSINLCGRKRPFDASETVSEPKRARTEPLYVFDLVAAITVLDRRIALMQLGNELNKRSVRFRAHENQDGMAGVQLNIISFGKLPENDILHVAQLWQKIITCSVRLRQIDRRVAWSFECLFADPPLVVQSERGNNTKSVVQEHHIFQNNLETTVDNIIESIRAYARLYAPVKRFATSFNRGMNAYVKVKAYTYYQLVLSYGPNFSYTIVINWRCADECFHLSFGLHPKSVTNLNANPHGLMSDILKHFFNRTHDLALLMQLLHETSFSLQALQQVARSNIVVPRPTERQFLEQQRPSPSTGASTLKMVLIPVSESVLRLIYGGIVCLEFMFLAGSRVAIRDCGSDGQINVNSKLLSLVGFKEFITNFQPSYEFDRVPSQTTNRHQASLDAPSPLVDQQPASVQSAHNINTIAFSPAPPSNAPLLTPSPAQPLSLSGLPSTIMEPSSVTSQHSTVVTPQTHINPDFGPSSMASNSSDIKLEFDSSQHEQNLSDISVSDDNWANSLTSSRTPVVVSSEALIACCKSDNSISPFENYLIGQITLCRFRTLVNTNTALKEQFTSLVNLPTGIRLMMRGCQELTNITCCARMDKLKDYSLQLKLNIVNISSNTTTVNITEDEIEILEKYFAQRLCPLMSVNAIASFLAIIRQTSHGVLRAFVSIMRQEMEPDFTLPWRAKLCLLQPYIRKPTDPSQTNAAGMPGVRQDKPQAQILFWVHFIPNNPSLAESSPPPFPLIFSTPNNKIALWGPPVDESNMGMNELKNILNRQNAACERLGDCPLFPAIRDIMENLQWRNIESR